VSLFAFATFGFLLLFCHMEGHRDSPQFRYGFDMGDQGTIHDWSPLHFSSCVKPKPIEVCRSLLVDS
jgi:hypothetical protein